jgi:hypothetical protein
MTAQRYSTYREFLQAIEGLSLRDGERDMLRDAAEGFLLARADDAWEVTELTLGASIVLDRVVDSRRITRLAADRLMLVLEASGPQGVALAAA